MTGKIAVLLIGTFLAATLSLPPSAIAGGSVYRGSVHGHSQGHFNGPSHFRGHDAFGRGHGHGHFRNFRHHHFGHLPVHPGAHFRNHGGWRWTGWSWVWVPGHWR